jgi:hypothetical protein
MLKMVRQKFRQLAVFERRILGIVMIVLNCLFVKFFTHVVSPPILLNFYAFSLDRLLFRPMLADDIGCGRRSEFRFKFKNLEKKEFIISHLLGSTFY